MTIYEKVVFLRHIHYFKKSSSTHICYSPFCIRAKETNTTLNYVPERVCKYYYRFYCIAYQACCDKGGPLWPRGPLYPPFPYATIDEKDAEATGEISCYQFIVRVHSLQRFSDIISEGYYSAAQRPLACEDVCMHVGAWVCASKRPSTCVCACG